MVFPFQVLLNTQPRLIHIGYVDIISIYSRGLRPTPLEMKNAEKRFLI